MKTCLYKMDVLSKQPPSTRMRVTVTDGTSVWLLECMRIQYNRLSCVCVNKKNNCIGNAKWNTVIVHKYIFKKQFNVNWNVLYFYWKLRHVATFLFIVDALNLIENKGNKLCKTFSSFFFKTNFVNFFLRQQSSQADS